MTAVAATKDRKSTRLNSSHLGISPLSLHDALPIWPSEKAGESRVLSSVPVAGEGLHRDVVIDAPRRQVDVIAEAVRVNRRVAEPRENPEIREDGDDGGRRHERSEEHTSELQSLRHLPSVPTRRSSDLAIGEGR